MNTLRESQVDLPEGMYVPFLATRELARLDPGSYAHSLMVGHVAVTAAHYGRILLTDEVKSAMYGHDVAKAFEPYRSLVLSPDKFTNEQRKTMDTHAYAGYEHWLNRGMSPTAAQLVLFHHTPYSIVRGFDFDTRPLELLTAADVLDAMVDPTRLHQTPLTLDTAILSLQKQKGTYVSAWAVDLISATRGRWQRDIYNNLHKQRTNLTAQLP